MVISLLAALAVFLAVVLLAFWMADRRGSQSDARAQALTLGRRPANIGETPFRERLLLPLVEGITRRVMDVLPPAFVARTEQGLTAAGNPMSVQAFFASVVALGILLPVVVFVLIWSVTDGEPGPALFLVPLGAVLGVAIPFIRLSRRVRARQLAIWKSLPSAFDLITTCVEAGLGLDAAFQRMTDKLEGPFADEVSQMLLEVEMGRPRREALEDIGHRAGVPDLLMFVNSVIQAQQLGTNLGKVLRAQSYQMRVKRRQRAEETARRMPVKMVFPLVFCTIPALFIIILGPVALTLIGEFSD